MSNPLHAACYADRAVHRRVEVVENVAIARDTFRLEFAAPEMAERIVPGQFVMVRLAGTDDPLLGRALALYDTVPDNAGRPAGLRVVYQVVGRMTRRLALVGPGQTLEAWGPLGNGFSPAPVEHLVMVAGGIGYTPMMALARAHLGLAAYGGRTSAVPLSARVTLCYGARSADYLADLETFERLGVDLRVSTDDGSRGHHGLVTDLLSDVLRQTGEHAQPREDGGAGQTGRPQGAAPGAAPSGTPSGALLGQPAVPPDGASPWHGQETVPQPRAGQTGQSQGAAAGAAPSVSPGGALLGQPAVPPDGASPSHGQETVPQPPAAQAAPGAPAAHSPAASRAGGDDAAPMPLRIACCGPEPMMEAVAKMCLAAGVPCELSLETPMACGIGICFSCVAKIRDDAGAWDYKRTCVEGPVFDAARVQW